MERERDRSPLGDLKMSAQIGRSSRTRLALRGGALQLCSLSKPVQL